VLENLVERVKMVWPGRVAPAVVEVSLEDE